MSWLWIGIAVGVAGLGLLRRALIPRSGAAVPEVDDDAVRRILHSGSLRVGDDDEPLDMDEAARAEEEFFGETWDEPDEMQP